ncbi:MAG: RNA polymerase sigma factor RpoD/SigA [Treponema sp.]|jgi:RNA polymerase primary sigma factor|nr:RNA polymerase sigma factor RpoD/SigA [Treponema sp.]
MIKRTQNSAQGDDILQAYFNQIKAIPLLTFEEELNLSRRIEQGDENARRRLIESNLRLVVKIARLYMISDVSLLDIIQEGNVGLIHAAGKYSYTKNVRFSTYANWWIRQSITRYLSNKRRVIRLPHRKEEILKKMQKAYHVLSQILHHQPSIEEIAAEVGVPQEEVDLILSMTNGMVSLEMETGEDSSVVDLHADYTYSPERALMKKISRHDTIHFLDRLKDKEKRILMYRFQLNGGERYTLKRIGAKMGISPETVRQIEIRALKKIRENADELKYCVTAM